MNAKSIQRHLHITENDFQLTDSERKQSRVSLHCIEMYSALLGFWEDDSKTIHVDEM